jgi:hypothetical protein
MTKREIAIRTYLEREIAKLAKAAGKTEWGYELRFCWTERGIEMSGCGVWIKGCSQHDEPTAKKAIKSLRLELRLAKGIDV